MNCSVDSEILHETLRDTTRISSCFSDFRVVSRTISCSISESLLHFMSLFKTVELLVMAGFLTEIYGGRVSGWLVVLTNGIGILQTGLV